MLIKKLPIFFLAVILLLAGLCSCSGDPEEEKIPDGMKIASVAGADYRLFVPQTWNLNTSYGISGAYLNLAKQSTVSVNRYEIDDTLAKNLPENGGERLSYFWENVCLPPIRMRAFDQSVTTLEDPKPTTLDGINARRFRFSALLNGETLHYLQVVAEKGNAFYVFTFTATEEYDDLVSETVEKMLTEFRFATPYVPEEPTLVPANDPNAPEGMKPAYTSDVAYRFYVPENWEIDENKGIYSAQNPSDRANVSVVPYLPAESNMSVADYWKETETLLQKMFPGESYVFLSSEEAILGGRNATAYEYKLTVNGTVYRYRQVIAVYKTMVYSLTYTAKEADFFAHLAEVAKMTESFSFR